MTKTSLLMGLVATLMLAAPASASIVIDDFATVTNVGDALPATDGGVTLGNGVVRTLTVSQASSGSDFGVVSGGKLSGGLSKGQSLTIEYDLTSASINRGFFVDRVLGLNLTANTFDNLTGGLDIAFAVASAGATTATASLTGLTSLVGFNMLDAVSGPSGNGHLAAFANADTISLTITNNAVGGFVPLTTFELNGGSISAVPEPASLALLGLTGLGGVVMVRRRRGQVNDSAA